MAGLLLSSCSLIFDVESANDDDDAGSVTVDANTDWWDPAWRKRVVIDVDNPVPVDLDAFPVLVVMPKALLNYSEQVDLYRGRLRTDSSEVPYQIDSITEEVVNLWFRPEAMLAEQQDMRFYFYYENPTGSQVDGKGDVWSAYSAVWHLQESEMAIPPQYKDSTNAGNHAADFDANDGSTRVDGVIGGAHWVQSTKEFATVPDAESLNPTECLSMSGWVFPEMGAPLAERGILDKYKYAGPGVGYQLTYASGAASNGPSALFSTVPDDHERTPNGDSVALVDDTWSHIGATINPDARQATMYVNGKIHGADQPIDGPLSPSADTIEMGEALYGAVDEIRISSRCMSAGWMHAEYLSIATPFARVIDVQVHE